MTSKLRKRAKRIELITIALLTISIGLVLCTNLDILAILNIKEAERQGEETIQTMTLSEQVEKNAKSTKSAVSSVTQINDLSDFIKFRDSVNEGNTYTGKTVYLNTDIDLSAVCNSTLGSWAPIGSETLPFRGVFEGQGHKINNIYIKQTTAVNQGLFGVIEGGQIKNLTMERGTVYVNNASTNGQTGAFARICK